MATKMYVNDTLVNVDEDTLKTIGDILLTGNPGSKTVVNAVNLAGGNAYADMHAAKNQDDVITIVRDAVENKRDVILSTSCRREILVNRLRLALVAATWQTEVKKEFQDGQPAKKSTTGQPVKISADF